MGWKLQLLKRLVEHDVKFVVVGGVAATSHGSARVTEDLDVCAPLDHENAIKIIRALSYANPRWRMRAVVRGDRALTPTLSREYTVEGGLVGMHC